MSAEWALLEGSAVDRLRELPAEVAQCCITSPPYFGLRDYGADGQIGLEELPEGYVRALVEVFREVWRVLPPDGTLYLNIGDSRAGSWGAQAKRYNPAEISRNSVTNHPKRASSTGRIRQSGVKPKDLYGIPWMVAFALRADGWFLRSEVIWAKPNPKPESVRDRPTSAHEHVFLLAKSRRYFYDAEAINGAGANKRDVWVVPTQGYPGAHFATFPPRLIEPMVLAGSRGGDTVLDPFAGSGTTLQVAVALGRHAIGIELNPDYAELVRRRMAGVSAPLFAG